MRGHKIPRVFISVDGNLYRYEESQDGDFTVANYEPFRVPNGMKFIPRVDYQHLLKRYAKLLGICKSMGVFEEADKQRTKVRDALRKKKSKRIFIENTN